MELEYLKSLISKPEEAIKQIQAEVPERKVADYLKQYDPKKHAITDPTKRKDKIIETDQGLSTAPVTRIPISMQKLIVSRAATFLCGRPIKLIANPTDSVQMDMLNMVIKVWEDNKLDYESLGLAKILFSETEVGEIWYSEAAEPEYWLGTPMDGSKIRLRFRLVANSKSDKLYPVFNMVGDLIAFGRAYTVSIAGKKEERFDIYTSDTNYFMIKSESGWISKSEVNFFKKIPAMYYSQALPEWSDVQEIIDRREVSLSNLADTNDYFGSPLIKAKGEIKGFSQKGEQGKVLELSEGAEAEYMSWDSSPESVKMEQLLLKDLSFELTDTADISFQQMKGLGDISGLALKMLFLAPHMKAADKEGIFGAVIQRRINFIKSALAIMNSKLLPAVHMSIKPQFEYFLPKDDAGVVNLLSTATGGKPIISQKTAVLHNPFVENPEVEMENLKAESEQIDPLETP